MTADIGDFFEKSLLERADALKARAYSLTRSASDADDLVQSVLLKALEIRPTITHDRDLSAWLFTVLYRQFCSDFRRRRNTRTLAEQPDVSRAEGWTDLAKKLEFEEWRTQVKEELPPGLNRVLTAMEDADWDQKIAAQQMGIERRLLRRHLQRLRHWFKRRSEDAILMLVFTQQLVVLYAIDVAPGTRAKPLTDHITALAYKSFEADPLGVLMFMCFFSAVLHSIRTHDLALFFVAMENTESDLRYSLTRKMPRKEGKELLGRLAQLRQRHLASATLEDLQRARSGVSVEKIRESLKVGPQVLIEIGRSAFRLAMELR